MFDFFRKLFSPIIAILDFITKYFKTIVFLTIVYVFMFSSNDSLEDGSLENANLQKIELHGPILDISKVLEELQEARDNKNIKGILFDVNSPGGSVAPSIEVAYAIKEISKIKPVVVYVSGVMASGGYYASIWGNKIIANPGSMIGSIGVIMEGVNAEELMKKVGVSTQVIKTGKYKESGTASRKWTDFEVAQLQGVTDDTYDMFVNDVASARKLNPAEHTKFADAQIFTARQAKKVGLIDEVATLSYAQNSLSTLAKVQKPVWKKEDKFEKFMNNLVNQTTSKISMALSDSLKAM